MSSGQTRYSLRPSARRAAQAARAAQGVAHNSDEDGDYLLDDEVPADLDDDGIDEMPDSPKTPTPAPRPDLTTGAPPPPEPGAGSAADDDDEAPAPSRPVRRRLFPEARPSGAITRPFSPLRPAPGGGARLSAPTAAAQAFPGGGPWRWRRRGVVADRPKAVRLGGAVVGVGGGGGCGRCWWCCWWWWCCGGGGGVVAERVSFPFPFPFFFSVLFCCLRGRAGARGLCHHHPNSTNAGAEGNAGFARQDNFVQWTNPVPESPFVLRQGVAPYGPFAGQRPNPRAPTANINAVPALPVPSNGYVESTAIDPANPYASFLRANSVALAQGHGAVTGQDSRGGSGAVPAAFSYGAFPDAFHDAFPDSFLGPASELHDPLIDQSHPTMPTAFPTASQHPALPESAQDPIMVLRRMDPAVARQSVENAQSVEYQLLQLKVRNRADADRAQNASNNLLTGTTQINDNGYAAIAFQVPNQADSVEMDNLSTVAQADSDSDATQVAASDSEHKATDSEHSDDATGCKDNANNNTEVISDEDDSDSSSDSDPPIPHVPPVSPMHVYNPHHNPAAAYWVAMPPAPLMEEYALLSKQPAINMYSSPPLPTFDTDPFLPFAPWRVSQLPPFHPEPTNRVITVAARYLPAIGQLYPDATFLVSRHPASANFTTRIKGRALTTSMALHFPHLLDPSLSDIPSPEADQTFYIVALAQRDWPIGGVAFLPNTPAAEAFVTALKESFDVLPNGQEAFYYIPHDIRLRSGADGKGKGVWVCRAYEGRQGPQDERIVCEWLRGQGGRVEEDEMGREVLVRMGEAWVEPERWPRVGAGKAGRGGRGGKKVRVVSGEDGEEEE
ncbi:hypothetical protein C8A01DRAFT_17383 [Parachaetomium inaequale]|uniref:Uncharacterized protein n=1 Tax=Parachaetomium inaequale TaxID=2588326 RepID=A0AAN6PG12_9PEZI|nr:hypothetical protein C8A01DRAFT_17383 [Parachaetomium inaequale]